MNQDKDIWDDIEMASQPDDLDTEMFELLSAYVDGECTAKEKRLVTAYLSSSSRAQDLLADLRAQAYLISETALPPVWLKEAILVGTVGKASTPARWGNWKLFVPTAAAVALVGAALLNWEWPIAPKQVGENAAATNPGVPSSPRAVEVAANRPAGEPNTVDAPPPPAAGIPAPYAENDLLTASEAGFGRRRTEGALITASMKLPEPTAKREETRTPTISTGSFPIGGAKSSPAKTQPPPTVPGSEIRMPAPKQPDVVAIVSDAEDPSPADDRSDNKPTNPNESLRAMLREHNKNRTDIKESDK